MATISTSNILHIGDLITLKYQKYGGYMSGEGILVNSVGLSTSLESFEDHLFEVCIQLQYSASNEYDEFMVDYNGDVSLITDKGSIKHYQALARGKENEIKMNDSFMKLKTGNEVLFGDTVQLRHYKSGNFITIKPSELARDERENMCVYLSSDGTQMSWLSLVPRYKIDREGDRISTNTDMLLKLAERNSEYIHCADKNPPLEQLREINSSMEAATPWRMSIYQSSQDSKDPSILLTGSLIYIRDPETGSVLYPFILPMDIEKSTNEVMLHTKENSDNDEKSVQTGSLNASLSKIGSIASIATDDKSPTLDEASIGSIDSVESQDEDDDDLSLTSEQEYILEYGAVVLKPMDEDKLDTNAIWIMESRTIIKGGPVVWKTEQVHFRHLNSGKYLAIHSDVDKDDTTRCHFSMSESSVDKKTLFQITELHSSSEVLTNLKAIQLRHTFFSCERGEYIDRHNVFVCTCTRKRTNAVNLIIARYKESSDQNDIKTQGKVAKDVFVGAATRNQINRFLRMTEIPSPRNSRASTIWPRSSKSDQLLFTVR